MNWNNAQVLAWKKSTPNQWRNRAFVSGSVVGVEADQPNHDHFVIQIGPNQSDVLEVVYNQEFGQLPDIQLGMKVIACGDFINAFAAAGPYPPSPAGAIVHWVHVNPRGQGHESGYLWINGILYGFEGDGQQGRRHDEPLSASIEAQ